jgi:hypothetical protein
MSANSHNQILGYKDDHRAHRNDLSPGINVEEESLLEGLMNVPGRRFALSYEKTVAWPEGRLLAIPVGDSDSTSADRA